MIRLFIADDHPIVREGLKNILSGCSDIYLAGETSNGNDVVNECEQNQVDVLLLDISMPGPGFLDIIHRLKVKMPALKTLVLSMHSEKHYAMRAIKTGAAGYLTKDHSTEELARAIRQVYKGNMYVTPAIAEDMFSLLQSDNRAYVHETLSDREYQIMCMIGEGKNTQEIAELLAISPKTIGTYRSRIFNKMKLSTNAELIRYVIEHNLIQ
jgi:DNA-binding NarL/FixJ family response regulator